MDVCVIWHPRYGVNYNEFEEIKWDKYEKKEMGGIRPTAKGVQLSLFSMWNGAFGK